MSYPTTLQIVGGKGGAPFSLTGEKNGASLEKIGVWVGGWQVKAVKAWLSDGRSETFGNPAGSYQEYAFKLGERFASLSLWANREGKRLGAIKFKTNRGGEFFAKMTDYELPTEIPIDVASGFCLGVEGRSGGDIDSMGFMFLKEVQSAVLTNVNYPTAMDLKPQVIEIELKSATYTNETSVKQQQILETSKKVTKKATWSLTGSLKETYGVEVKAGIPGILEVSSGHRVTIGQEGTYSLEESEEKTETLTTTVEIPPNKVVDVDITIGRVTFELPYTGTVMVTCKNGSVWQYETNGIFKSITYTDINVNTKESDL